MAYLNERTSIEDYQKYIEPCDKSVVFSNWTIDRERESFLANTSIVREDMYEGKHEISYWLFLWEGEYIYFEQHRYVDTTSDDENHVKVTNVIKRIDMSSAVKLRKKEMFIALKEAMDVNKGYGVLGSDKYTYDINLDISKVI